MTSTVQEHNAETNEIKIRPATKKESESFQVAEAATEERQLAEAAKAAEKAALLEKLGISEDEAKLLLA